MSLGGSVAVGLTAPRSSTPPRGLLLGTPRMGSVYLLGILGPGMGFGEQVTLLILTGLPVPTV